MHWRRDHTGAHDPQAIGRRRAYLKNARRRDVQMMELALLPLAQIGRRALIAEHARPFLARLDLINEVSLATSMPGLLALAEARGDDRRLVRLRLEALMTFDAVIGMHELDHRASFAESKRVLDAFNRGFAEAYFDGSVERVAWSSHDINDHYHVTRVADADPGPMHTRHVIKHTFFCRLMRLQGARVPVIFDYRLKGRFEEWLKAQKQYDDPLRHANAFQVYDRCGLRLVASDRARVEPMMAEIGAFLQRPELGVSIVEPRDTRDARNRHSDKRFSVAKLIVSIAGHFFEIQVPSVRDQIVMRYATDGMNHDLYRLFQCLDVYFPLLFPTRVYGVDWRDPLVRHELTDLKIRSLGLIADIHIRRRR